MMRTLVLKLWCPTWARQVPMGGTSTRIPGRPTIQRALRTPLLGERPLGRARQLLLPSIAAVDYCDLRKKAKYQLHWISCTSESETSAACASSSIQ